MKATEIGRLVIEEMDDLSEVTVKPREGNDVGYATFIRCPKELKEWEYLKNNANTLNGHGETPPAGRWVLAEYVGRDQASANQAPEKAADGLSNRDILASMVAVNVFFAGDGYEQPLIVGKLRRPRAKKFEKGPGIPHDHPALRREVSSDK